MSREFNATDLGWPFDLFIHNVPLGMRLFSEIEGSSEPVDAFVAGLRRLGFYLPMPPRQQTVPQAC